MTEPNGLNLRVFAVKLHIVDVRKFGNFTVHVEM